MNKVLVIILAVCVAACAAVGVGVYVYTNDDTDEPQIPSDPSTDPPVDEPITPPEEPSVNPPVETPEGDFTVTFMMNSAVNSGVYLTVYVDEGETVAEPAEPEKPKATYVFVKWTTDKDNRNAYDFTTPVTGDLVLYADWDVMGTSSGSRGSQPTQTPSEPPADDEDEPAEPPTEEPCQHEYEPATCTESEGENCIHCGEPNPNPKSATGHDVGEYDDDGKFAPKCSVCGETYKAMLSTLENVKTYHTEVKSAFDKASAGNTIHLATDMDSRISLTTAVIISAHNHKVNLSYTNEEDIKILKDGCNIDDVDVTLKGMPVGFIAEESNDYLVVLEATEVSNADDLIEAISKKDIVNVVVLTSDFTVTEKNINFGADSIIYAKEGVTLEFTADSIDIKGTGTLTFKNVDTFSKKEIHANGNIIFDGGEHKWGLLAVEGDAHVTIKSGTFIFEAFENGQTWIPDIILADNGKLYIEGGEITLDGHGDYSIHLGGYSKQPKNVVVHVKGGTINSGVEDLFYTESAENNKDNTHVWIAGGVFNLNSGKVLTDTKTWGVPSEYANGITTITGGTFFTSRSDLVAAYVADGYELVGDGTNGYVVSVK